MLGDDRLGGGACGFWPDSADDNRRVIAFEESEFAGFVGDGSGRPVLDKRAKLALEGGDDGDAFQSENIMSFRAKQGRSATDRPASRETCFARAIPCAREIPFDCAQGRLSLRLRKRGASG